MRFAIGRGGNYNMLFKGTGDAFCQVRVLTRYFSYNLVKQ